jgi:hypothetical protein
MTYKIIMLSLWYVYLHLQLPSCDIVLRKNLPPPPPPPLPEFTTLLPNTLRMLSGR